MKYKLIVFDFDGTIADYMPYILKIFNEVAEKLNFKKIDNLKKVRSMTVRKFLKEQHIPFYRLPFLLKQAQKVQLKYMEKMKLHNNMKEVLLKLHKDCKIGILSSNSKKVIYSFLGRHKIETLFDFVIGYPKIFAKYIPLTQIMLEHGLKSSEILYVGDEIRDIQATKKIHIDCAAVTWGFNSEEFLKKYKPAYIINKPDELLKIITQHN